MTQSNWFLIPEPKINPSLRVLCFSYAGGNASTFVSLASSLPANVELVIVQLPGRTTRWSDAPYSDMDLLVEDLLSAFQSLEECPYILFGHSLGSKIAFQLMNRCVEKGLPGPEHFIASGCRSPHLPAKRRSFNHLSDQEFITELKKLNGTPDTVLENPELMALYLPVIRADFWLSDNYRFVSEINYTCGLSVFGGVEDVGISKNDLQAWEKFFTQGAEVHMFNGDHFFIESNKNEVWQKVVAIVHQVSSVSKNNLASLQFAH
jgi:surfactin synthase thioesterase subunit